MSHKIYPIGIQNFEKIRNDGYFYIDKTALMYQMVKTGSYYFLSRPRRFGKSLLVSTLEAYFQGKKELFEGLAVEKLEKDWIKYPILHLDLNIEKYDTSESLDNILDKSLTAWEKLYGAEPSERSFSLRFAGIIERACKLAGQRVVILVDEYDKPMLQAIGNEELQKQFRNTLKPFYGALKTMDGCIKFAFLTGVTKFGKVSVFSDLNNLDDISMWNEYVEICGISEREIHNNLETELHEFAAARGITYDKLCEELRECYDGYHFTHNSIGMYNPFSLLNAFKRKDFGSYWFETGTPTYLVRLLSHFRENMNELTGKYYRPEEFVDYKADMEQPLPMIYQSGYLTIKDYDMDFNTFLLDFPNNEVKNGFLTVLATSYLKPSEETGGWIREVVRTLRAGNPEKLCTLFTSFLAGIPYTMRRKEDEAERERYFQYTFYLIMRLVSVYTVYVEKVQSQGRVDCIVETPEYVYIFEFKLDGTASDALRQIEEKGYAREYASDSRKLYRIGAVFSSETGTIGEWKAVCSDK